MKRDTRAEILSTARRLFNERGYNAVSMGDIAGAVGISKGNLTYHFPKKEALVEAIVLDMHRGYKPPEVPRSLPEMNAYFMRIQTRISQNAYYFWHYNQLAQLSPAIQEMQGAMTRDRSAILREAFKGFVAAGWMQPEEFPGQHEHTLYAVLTLCVYWIPHSRLLDGAAQDTFLDCVWSPLYPLLTPKGKRIYTTEIAS